MALSLKYDALQPLYSSHLSLEGHPNPNKKKFSKTIQIYLAGKHLVAVWLGLGSITT